MKYAEAVKLLESAQSLEALASVFTHAQSRNKLVISVSPYAVRVSGNTYAFREDIKAAAARAALRAQWTGTAWEIPVRSVGQAINVIKELTQIQAEIELPLKPEAASLLSQPAASYMIDRNTPLFPFQAEGVQAITAAFRRGARSFLLADEMGLGKTFQALVAVRELGLEAVVIAPASLVPQWGIAAARAGVRAQVFSYTKAGDADARGKALILDEAHFVKNPRAQRTRAVRALVGQARFTIALTGTPLLNRIEEFANLLETLSLIRSAYAFLQRYASCELKKVKRDKYVKEYYLTSSQMQQVRSFLNSAIPYLRRLKSEVGLQLPRKLRSVIPLPAAAPKASQVLIEAAAAEAARLGITYHDDQALIDTVFDHLPASAISTARRLYAIAKAEAAAAYLQELLESSEKPIVVFYHHQEVLQVLLSILPAPYIDGSVPASDRARIVADFQAGRHSVLYLSITAAGVGLTLTAADTAVFVEYDWVPANLLQAEDRINRIGQDSETTMYHYLTSQDAVEQHILKKLLSKTALASGVLGGDKLTIS